MEFNEFKKVFQQQFKKMIKDQNRLFLTDVDKNDLWEHYLDNFPEGTNKVYKGKREYDCNSCKQFIRSFANIVTIKNNKLISIWDIPDLEFPFNEVARSMSFFVKLTPIKDVFVTKDNKLGIDKNHQELEDGKIIKWEHFYYELPRYYIENSSDSIEAIQGRYRDLKNVFMRSMKELTIDSGKIILELIEQGSLYRGEEHKKNIQTFLKYKKEFENLKKDEQDNWCWNNNFNNSIAKIRNSALGTLLIDLSKDIDVDTAVKKFESVMAPSNYKRPKPIFTKKMIEDAQNKVEELGFTNSLKRRFAQLDDITINNILFVNRDVKNKLKNSVFDNLKEEIPINSKKFDKVEEVSIEDFIKNILPKTTNLELMIENKHNNNLMSLIAPENKDALTMFKWDNNFSWAYNGDIADSDIKKNVKNAGGNVEGVLRFSIQWNNNRDNNNDFDAHCIEPSGNIIMFNNMYNRQTSGILDVDITRPMTQVPNGPAVENITWTNKNKMEEKKYIFLVHNFSHNGGRTGFSAEIEYDGQIYSFEYSKELKNGEKVIVAEIEFDREKGIKFIKSLDSSVSSKKLWEINTNKFSKVNICMYSPNYWNKQKGIGNKHYFFFLNGCKNEAIPRGFFNEFLNEKLTEHKKVFEALGSKMRVEDSDNQLSGVGFSSTQRNSILAKIEGSVKRVIKIKF